MRNQTEVKMSHSQTLSDTCQTDLKKKRKKKRLALVFFKSHSLLTVLQIILTYSYSTAYYTENRKQKCTNHDKSNN